MKILVVGVSVRAMVASAVNSGYTVVALDAFGDQDMRQLAETHALHREFNVRYSAGALYRASRKLSCDAVAYTSNLENYPGILERFGGARTIIGNSPQTVRAVRSWTDLFVKLRQAGFPTPATICAGESKKANSRLHWLVKPVLSGGGHGITFQKHSRPIGRRFMLQEYISGKSCSASFVANGHDCILLGITRQLTGLREFGSQGFRYCGNILPLAEAVDPDRSAPLVSQVRRLALFLTREYGLTGVNGIDFILSDKQIYLTEVNPRYSASMELIEQAYALPIFHLHVNASQYGHLPEFRVEDVLHKRKFFGKAILFSERNAVAPDTKGWLDSGARDIPSTGEKLLKGNPICTVLANGPSRDQTLKSLVQKAARIKEEIHEQSTVDPDNGTIH